VCRSPALFGRSGVVTYGLSRRVAKMVNTTVDKHQRRGLATGGFGERGGFNPRNSGIVSGLAAPDQLTGGVRNPPMMMVRNKEPPEHRLLSSPERVDIQPERRRVDVLGADFEP
jgi:hypothetical protein